MCIPIDCWLFMPSLSGLPVLLALWSAVPSFELHFAWPFVGAGAASAPLSGWPVLFVRFFLCLGLVEGLGVCWAFCFLGVFAWAAAAAAAALRLCAVYLGAVHITKFHTQVVKALNALITWLPAILVRPRVTGCVKRLRLWLLLLNCP